MLYVLKYIRFQIETRLRDFGNKHQSFKKLISAFFFFFAPKYIIYPDSTSDMINDVREWHKKTIIVISFMVVVVNLLVLI